MKKISVIIPSYNKREYIEQAIESVLNQTYKNYELIVIDDGSTDGTIGVIEKYKERLILIQQENQGQSTAINNGWKISSGDLIGYLSADDYFDLELLEVINNTFSNNSIVGAYPNIKIVNSYGKFIKNIELNEFEYKKVIEELECPPSVGFFITREIYNAYGGWDSKYKRIPDYEYILRIGSAGKFKKIPRVLGTFRISNSSYSTQVLDLNIINEPFIVIEDFINKNKKLPDNSNPKIALANAMLMSGQLAARSEKYFIGLRYWIKAVLIYPNLFFKKYYYHRIINGIFFKYYLKYKISK